MSRRRPRVQQPAERAGPEEMRERRRVAAGAIAARAPREDVVLLLMGPKYGLSRKDALVLIESVREEIVGNKITQDEARALQLYRLHSISAESRAKGKQSAAVSAEHLIADLEGTRQPIVIRSEGPAADRERLIAVLMRFDEKTVGSLLGGERHVALGHAGHAEVGKKLNGSG